MPKSPDAFRTITEVADWLETPAHVLRFWESKFTQVKPVKRAGGRRYYRPADMELLGGIKKLLHDDGMTIKGVQKVLREQGVKYVTGLSDPVDPEDDTDKTAQARAETIEDAPFAEVADTSGEVVAFRPDSGDTDADAAVETQDASEPAEPADFAPEHERLDTAQPEDSAGNGLIDLLQAEQVFAADAPEPEAETLQDPVAIEAAQGSDPKDESPDEAAQAAATEDSVVEQRPPAPDEEPVPAADTADTASDSEPIPTEAAEAVQADASSPEVSPLADDVPPPDDIASLGEKPGAAMTAHEPEQDAPAAETQETIAEPETPAADAQLSGDDSVEDIESPAMAMQPPADVVAAALPEPGDFFADPKADATASEPAEPVISDAAMPAEISTPERTDGGPGPLARLAQLKHLTSAQRAALQDQLPALRALARRHLDSHPG